MRRRLRAARADGSIWLLLIVFILVVEVAVAAWSVLRAVPPPATFAYTSAEAKPATICAGDDLAVTVSGVSSGRANYTIVGHEIYEAGTTRIALRLNDPDPVVGANLFFDAPAAFSFPVRLAEVRDLEPGAYTYVRAAVQLPGSQVTAVEADFFVISCLR